MTLGSLGRRVPLHSARCPRYGHYQRRPRARHGDPRSL